MPGETDPEKVKTSVDRLRQKIEDGDILFDDKTIHKTSSFGIAKGKGFDELEKTITLADKAMYKAKDGGRNRVEVG